MFTENKLRREFLKGAGTGLAGTALAARAGQGTAMAAAAETKPGTFNVRAFGAAGDGKSLDTEAVNKAIGAAAAAGGVSSNSIALAKDLFLNGVNVFASFIILQNLHW